MEHRPGPGGAAHRQSVRHRLVPSYNKNDMQGVNKSLHTETAWGTIRAFYTVNPE